MEIKLGDKVKVAKDAPQMYIAGVGFVFTEIASTVTKIDYPENTPEDQTLRIEITPFNFMEIPSIYVERVENEEQTEAETDANEKLQEEFARFMSGHTPISFADRIEREHIQRRMRVLSQDDFLKDFNPAEHEVNPKPLNTEFWVKYEADLAKEIAVKLSKPNENKPGYVADYAVQVAKAVVENLKQK